MTTRPFRRRSRWIWSSLGALLILSLSVLSVQGGDPRGAWMSTAFQVINLEPVPMPFVARFLALDGTPTYTVTDTLPPGEARFYAPTEMIPPLPATFTGTLSVDAPGQVAMAILHLETEAEGGANEVFTGIADERLDTRAFAPLNRCILLYIHNLHPTSTASMQLNAFDTDGAPVGSLMQTIMPEGAFAVYPVLALGLPLDFVGSALAQADRPVKVTVLSFCDGLSALVAPPQGDNLLYAPNIPPYIPGLMTPTLTIRNTGVISAQVGVVYRSGVTETLVIPPLGMAVVAPPRTYFLYLPLVTRGDGSGHNTVPSPAFGDGPRPAEIGDSAVILATQPVVVFVRTISSRLGEQGIHVYRAFAPGEATPAVALPILFSGYEGWETINLIWIRNVGLLPTDVAIRYVTVPTGTVAWDHVFVGAGEVAQVMMPPLDADLAAAILLADQPIVVLTGALNPQPTGLEDRLIRYPGRNFDFACAAVTATNFTWNPTMPLVGQAVVFTAWPVTAGWSIEAADSVNEVGQYTSLALDAAGRPHVSYYDYTDSALKYTYHDGTTWYTETVDSAGVVGRYTSLALDAADRPHISYLSTTAGDLRYAYHDGTTWYTETVDSTAVVSSYTSLALDAAGLPRIGYYDATNGDLKYAHHDGTTWYSETVDSAGDVGSYASLALDAADLPHVSYYDATSGTLEYAYYDGAAWYSETVDGAADVGSHTSLVLDATDLPRISYYDATNGDLKYARHGGTVWHTETVDSSGNVGTWTSLALDAFGHPHISYFDPAYGDLKYAYSNGTSWRIETVDSFGMVGYCTSLALDAPGYPHISYYDATRDDLNYARAESPTHPISFTWDFSDGSIGLGATVTHTFATTGTYTVSMTATNCLEFGKASARHTLTVTIGSKASCFFGGGSGLADVDPVPTSRPRGYEGFLGWTSPPAVQVAVEAAILGGAAGEAREATRIAPRRALFPQYIGEAVSFR